MKTFSIPRMQELAGVADAFDEDHWRLLDKINTLLQAIAAADDTEVLMAFGSLRLAAQEHFAREEATMRASGYRDLERHRQSHRHLLDSLSSLQFMLNNTKGLASNIGPFAQLEQWFDAHLGNDDRQFADFLARQAPATAATASAAGSSPREDSRVDAAEA